MRCLFFSVLHSLPCRAHNPRRKVIYSIFVYSYWKYYQISHAFFPISCWNSTFGLVAYRLRKRIRFFLLTSLYFLNQFFREKTKWKSKCAFASIVKEQTNFFKRFILLARINISRTALLQTLWAMTINL